MSILILCPTHDHADTLYISLASVRAQTIEDWRLVVIGDGAPERTRNILSAAKKIDDRIEFVMHPKGNRFGEVYRDPVIRNFDVDYVFQISDDDLWAPHHLETMLELLRQADWVNQAPLRLLPNGTSEWWFINHGTPQARNQSGRRISAGPNFVAYRRDAYLSLPEGWTAAPEPGPSDQFMWAKFHAQPSISVASTAKSTS